MNAVRNTSTESVSDEYNKLFVGMTRGEIIPYASWYLTGFLMEKPLSELRDDLRRLGIRRREESHEPEDHVAALLEAMSILIGTGACQSQRHFFDTHINSWMGDLFRDMKSAPSARFYRSVAQLAGDFLHWEAKLFGE